MQITNVTMPQNKYNIKCPYSMEPQYITIHNTANDGIDMLHVSFLIGIIITTSLLFGLEIE